MFFVIARGFHTFSPLYVKINLRSKNDIPLKKSALTPGYWTQLLKERLLSLARLWHVFSPNNGYLTDLIFRVFLTLRLVDHTLKCLTLNYRGSEEQRVNVDLTTVKWLVTTDCSFQLVIVYSRPQHLQLHFVFPRELSSSILQWFIVVLDPSLMSMWPRWKNAWARKLKLWEN